MKRILDKVLDSYDRRNERREEIFERALTRNVEALSDRRILKINIAVLGGADLLLWAAVLFVPRDLLWAFNKINAVNERITLVVIAIVFGIGLWLTYSLLRLRYPDLEERSSSSEPMSSFADQEKATRKIRVWIAAVVGGILNLLAMALVFGLLVSEAP